MRTIKFRAWNQVMEKMFTWNDFLNTNMKNTFIAPKSTAMILMQYTGLHDKNGKEIYEGDIISTGEPINEIYLITQNICGWEMRNIKKPKHHKSFHYLYKYKVIGNIYENPELLERNSNGE